MYDAGEEQGHRVLVDRLWPRGVAKQSAPFDQWCKEVAPTSELRSWYAHKPERFEEFARRYKEELQASPAKEAIADLRARARAGELVLITATKDVEHSAAHVLQSLLSRPHSAARARA